MEAVVRWLGIDNDREDRFDRILMRVVIFY